LFRGIEETGKAFTILGVLRGVRGPEPILKLNWDETEVLSKKLPYPIVGD